MKQYDIVYSLGSNCRMADYLRVTGLRLASGPFDWICGGGGICNILAWICREMQGFIEKEDLVIDEEEIVPKRTIWYRNERTGFKFPHEFIYGREFNEMYVEVRAKYDRRISRFLEDLRTKNVLLTYLARDSRIETPAVTESFLRLREKFGSRVDLMCFANGQPEGEVVRENPADGLHIVRFHDDGVSTGDARINKKEEAVVLPILRTFSVPGGRLSNKWRAFKRMMWKSKISRRGNRTYRFFGIPVWRKKVAK